MMRSLFSGVSGLKTHQVKMDVIGNNIANVNTTSYKSASITFSDIMYQTTQNASGANAATGRAGVNARQIGLGVQSAAISNSVTTAGATQTTGNPFDVKINGESFFIVSDGTQNFFTRDGSFYVDGVGNLAMSSNGNNVMGWQVDPATGTIKKDTVSALRIMTEANMTYPPEATTEAYIAGILDKNEPDAATESGKTIALTFFDNLGYTYTAKFSVKDTTSEGLYTVDLADIVNSEGESIVDQLNVTSLDDIISFGSTGTTSSSKLYQLASDADYDPLTDQFYMTKDSFGIVKDFNGNKISGVVYDATPRDEDGNKLAPAAAGDPDPAAGDNIYLSASGTVPVKDMEEFNGLYFNNDSHSYWQGGGGTGTELPVELKDPNDETDPDERALTINKWKVALKLAEWDDETTGTIKNDKTDPGSFNVAVDKQTGNVTFNVLQKFDVADEYKTATYDGKKWKTEALTTDAAKLAAYGLENKNGTTYVISEVAPDGRALIQRTDTYQGYELAFDVNTGKFKSIGGADSSSIVMDFKDTAMNMNGETIQLGNFKDINVDWSNVSWYNNNGTSTMAGTAGLEAADGERPAGYGKGRKNGEMSGISIQNNGEIYASYDNGQTKLLGQIAVANFANASGLEKVGDNLYSATLNSGEFDGVGVDITANGGSMSTGALEMSNVDLSNEFTSMITTQRGFQANSRIITVSDTLLEELVNLKR